MPTTSPPRRCRSTRPTRNQFAAAPALYAALATQAELPLVTTDPPLVQAARGIGPDVRVP